MQPNDNRSKAGKAKAASDRAIARLSDYLYRRSFTQVPANVGVGEFQAWGMWMNFCPHVGEKAGHLWTSHEEVAVVAGHAKGVALCPDHAALVEGWPNAEGPDHVAHFGQRNEADEDEPIGCAW